MRYPLILFIVFLQLSCSHGSRRKATTHKRVLAPADLKFPFVDEQDDIPLFPKPNNENIARNNVRTFLTEGTVIDMDNWQFRWKEDYLRANARKKIKFIQWFRQQGYNQEKRQFDSTGRLCEYQSLTLMGVTWKFAYDSNGFITDWGGGSCVIRAMKYLYYFNTDKNCLYQVTIDKQCFNYLHLTYYLSLHPKIYQFDTLGYLVKLTQQAQGYDSINGFRSEYNFTYNSNHKIERICHHYYEHNGSNNTMVPIICHDRIPNYSFTQYSYSSGYLDSVITRSTFNSQPNFIQTRVTYYRKDGLPYKTLCKNVWTKFATDGLVYTYTRCQ